MTHENGPFGHMASRGNFAIAQKRTMRIIFGAVVCVSEQWEQKTEEQSEAFNCCSLSVFDTDFFLAIL